MRLLLACLLAFAATPALAQDPPRPGAAVADMARRPVVMTLPGMDQAVVTRDIRYGAGPQPHLLMDVYRPAGLKAAERRPGVIFIHGRVPEGAPAKDMGVYRSYGRLMAAQGLVGVTFTHRLSFPEPSLEQGAADVAAAIAYARAHAAELNLDPDRLCLAAYSAGGPMLAPYMENAGPEIRCIVAFYPIMDTGRSPMYQADPPAIRQANDPMLRLGRPGRKTPTLVARAGADAIPGLLDGLDRFTAEALKADYPLTLANNPGAPHAFDITEPTPRTLEILDQAFAFLRRHLAD